MEEMGSRTKMKGGIGSKNRGKNGEEATERKGNRRKDGGSGNKNRKMEIRIGRVNRAEKGEEEDGEHTGRRTEK